MSKRGELDAHIVFEAPDAESAEKMRRWLISVFKEAAKYSTTGFVATSIYDEDGRLVGTSTIGTASASVQKLLDEAFELKESA